MRAAKFTAVVSLMLCMFAAVASAEYSPSIPAAGALPADAVAVVESTPITKKAFDTAFDVSASYEDKLSAKRRASLRQNVLTSLVNRVRTQVEANSLGIVVSDLEVEERFSALKQQSFPTDRDYRQFLEESGQVEADLLTLVRASMYQERLQESWSSAAAVTDQEVVDEYTAHRDRYVIPESRDILMIYTWRRAAIYKARAALRRGRSFKETARKYSKDATRRFGGRFPGVTKGQFPRALDRAVFKAKRGELVGPIKTQYGYYLVRVARTHKARQLTFMQARKRIRETLLEERKAALTKSARASFEQRWKAATLCRTGYVAKVCGGYAG